VNGAATIALTAITTQGEARRNMTSWLHHAGPARAAIPAPCYFLLRPDRYIGLAGVKLQEGDLRRYFAERIER
jgi:hypothetical protein